MPRIVGVFGFAHEFDEHVFKVEGEDAGVLCFRLLAGEPLYARDVRRWRRAMGERIELVNLYGPAETTLAKAFYRIGDIPDTENGIIPLGSPIDDTELLILRDGRPCTVRQVGEIHIRTRYPSKGYRNQLEDFVDSIRTGNPPAVTLADGIRSTIACLRILESAASGLPCAIDWESTLKAK